MKTKEIFINDLKPGDNVNSSFLVTEKNMAFSQKGSAYLNLRLKDKTGEVDGKIWENAADMNKLFKRGDIIRIRSKAVSFKNVIQLSIYEVDKLNDSEINHSDYFPASKNNIEIMFAEIISFVDKIETPYLKSLLDAFFSDEEIVRLFKKSPAAKNFHHAYIGGLLEHTLSVVKLLNKAADFYQCANKDMLITGGILHDIGKIYELSYDKFIDYRDEGRLIGHIVIGVEMLNSKMSQIKDFPEHVAMELRHLIISHHGAFEFGSPKLPKTLEALIVHHIDDLDAKVNAFKEFIENSEDGDSNWTTYHKLLERYIYKG